MKTTALPVEDFQAFYDSNKERFEEHYKQCEEYRASKKDLDINVGLFQELIDAGVMNFYTLWLEEECVGYINVTFHFSPIFNQVQAVVDFLYIDPACRSKGLAKAFMKEIEDVLLENDCNDLSLSLPNKDYADGIASSLGFVKTSTMYTKHLEE